MPPSGYKVMSLKTGSLDAYTQIRLLLGNRLQRTLTNSDVPPLLLSFLKNTEVMDTIVQAYANDIVFRDAIMIKDDLTD